MIVALSTTPPLKGKEFIDAISMLDLSKCFQLFVMIIELTSRILNIKLSVSSLILLVKLFWLRKKPCSGLQPGECESNLI